MKTIAATSYNSEVYLASANAFTPIDSLRSPTSDTLKDVKLCENPYLGSRRL